MLQFDYYYLIYKDHIYNKLNFDNMGEVHFN